MNNTIRATAQNLLNAARIARDTLAADRRGDTTVAAFLTLHGCNEAWQSRWASAFGHRSADAYRARHGHQPRQIWQSVNGHATRVYCYPLADVDLLRDAWIHYDARRITPARQLAA
ncbi:hypothetical protein [Streptomyces sp. NPDC057910]|uniref:hypothetical protein n=1 Tax=Streptomyces sp. NPDC057910 TaxID=3346278 RepID=UPI0036E3BD82